MKERDAVSRGLSDAPSIEEMGTVTGQGTGRGRRIIGGVDICLSIRESWLDEGEGEKGQGKAACFLCLQ